MTNIAIISSSIRTNRVSHRVALYFKNYLLNNSTVEVKMLDLCEYDFPLFHERLKYLPNPDDKTLDFAQQIRAADGVIIVTPEYNGTFPPSLKNVIDLLTDDWKKKPVAISTVSNGDFGGVQSLISLQFSLWKIKAWTVNAMFPVPRAHEAFDENGNPKELERVNKRADGFINELLWAIEAKKRMND